eukprot:441296_1
MGADLSASIKLCSVTNYDATTSTKLPKDLIVNSFKKDSISSKFYIVSKNESELIIKIIFSNIIELQNITLFALPNDHIITASAPKLIHIYNVKQPDTDVSTVEPDTIIECESDRLINGQITNVNYECCQCLIINIKSNQNNARHTHLNGIVLKGGIGVDRTTTKYDENVVMSLMQKGFTRKQIMLASSMTIDYWNEALVYEQLQCLNLCSNVYTKLAAFKRDTPHQIQAKSNQWACPACTYQSKCSMCSTKPSDEEQKQPMISPISSQNKNWHCSACTFTNTEPQHQCSMCGASRTNMYADTEVTVDHWTCHSCTFHNALQQNMCSVCLSPKHSKFRQFKPMPLPSRSVPCDIVQCSSLHNVANALCVYQITCSVKEASADADSLKRIFKNIIENPNETKYQKISLSKLCEKLKNCEKSMNVLCHVGFIKSTNGKYLLYNMHQLNKLQKAYDLLKSASESTLDDLFDNYTEVDLTNDHHHLLYSHKHDVEYINDYINAKCSSNRTGDCCNATACDAMRRHRADRSRQNQSDTYYCDQLDTKTIARLQSMDALHSHYCHIFDLIPKRRVDGSEQKMNRNDKPLDVMNKCKYVSTIDKMTINKPIFSIGYRYFYWKHYKGNPLLFDNGTFRARNEFHHGPANEHPNGSAYTLMWWYVDTKFSNLKMELTQNPICSVSMHLFETKWHKAKVRIESAKARPMVCFTDTREDDYGILEGTLVTLEHLLVMIMYCDLTDLCTKFSGTYRKLDSYEGDKALKTRHANFANMGRLLRELVDCWGWQYDADKYSQDLYHGLNAEYQLSSVHACIKGPFSTTQSSLMALTFCDNQGMVLTLTPDFYHTIPRSECAISGMDCQWLSKYSYEQEVFFIGGYSGFDLRNITFPSGAPYCKDYCLALCALVLDFQGMMSWSMSRYMEAPAIQHKYQRQMVYRLFLHELHRSYPENKDFVALNGIPEYIDNLLHLTFQNIRKIKLLPTAWHSDVAKKMCGKYFVMENGWIKLQELLTVFPRLNKIYLNLDCNIQVSLDWICQWMFEFIQLRGRRALNQLRRIEIELEFSGENLFAAKLADKKYSKSFLDSAWFIRIKEKQREEIILFQFMSCQDDMIRQAMTPRVLKGLFNMDDSGLFNVNQRGCSLM